MAKERKLAAIRKSKMKVVCWAIVLFSFGGAETEAAKKKTEAELGGVAERGRGLVHGLNGVTGRGRGPIHCLGGVARRVRGFVYGFGGVAGRDRGLVHVLSEKKAEAEGRA